MVLTADTLKLELQPLEARTAREFQGTFSKMLKIRPARKSRESHSGESEYRPDKQ
jgi:hypothetical protein